MSPLLSMLPPHSGSGAAAAPSGMHAMAPPRGDGPPPFDPRRLQRELATDGVLRWGLLGVLLVVVMLGAQIGGDSIIYLLLIAGLVFGWIMLNMTSVRVSQQVPVIGALTDSQPRAAESLLAAALKKRGLQRSVRLLLYHRLAVLRHRQRQFAEAATISRAVLDYPIRAAMRVRPQLLLIYGESVLQCGDYYSAHVALVQLHQVPLRLVELLQLLSLQTRYEVAAGHDQYALWNLREKVRLVELMPAEQCGAMHGLFAVAASRQGREATTRWLRERAELLCTPKQLETLHQVTTAASVNPEPDAPVL